MHKEEKYGDFLCNIVKKVRRGRLRNCKGIIKKTKAEWKKVRCELYDTAIKYMEKYVYYI